VRFPKPERGSWRNTKVGFCVGRMCNTERPLVKKRGRHHCSVCGDRVELPSKMRNQPVRSKHTGRLIHSKKEAAWEPTLIAMLNAGQIRDLQPQGPLYAFHVYSNGQVLALIEEVRELVASFIESSPTTDRLTRAANDVERSIVAIPGRYRPDWTFHDTADGRFHVHDVKGHADLKYRRDKALMLACHGLEVEEPEPRGIQQRARGAGVAGRGTGSRLMGGRP